MSVELVTALLFGSLVVGLFTGLPIVFVLGGIAMLFTYFLWGSGALFVLANNTIYRMTDLIMIAVPMFVFMANMLERSGIADELYELMYSWFGFLRGGLASGTVVICTIFAAMCGTSAAAAITMGLIALPSMLKRGYAKPIAIGSIMAGAALGQLIPPSILLVVIGMAMSISVGKLLIGGILPGLLLSAFFIIYISVRCAFQPHLGPEVPREERGTWSQKVSSLKALILPSVLIVAVLGSIFLELPQLRRLLQ